MRGRNLPQPHHVQRSQAADGVALVRQLLDQREAPHVVCRVETLAAWRQRRATDEKKL